LDLKTNALKNAEKSIEEAKNIICFICEKPGAGLACAHFDNRKQCGKFFHFMCARKAKFGFCRQKYSVYCSDHKSNVQLAGDYKNKKTCQICNSKLDDIFMKKCSKCHEHFHCYCTSTPINNANFESKSWKCENCQ
jgi:hypothetical protein